VNFIADFHIHSHFSISTSKDLCPEALDYWARVKGIAVIGSGDCIHPGWLAELKAKLDTAEQGLYQLKPSIRRTIEFAPQLKPDSGPRFILTTEISTIYSRDNKVRKVHHLIFFPDFEAAETFQRKLSRIGNISSDGRPILGISSRNLLEIALECSDDIFFVPAHIWTPWFSALGAQSGYDSIEECYADLSSHIRAIEMGLSSHPAMNWLCSRLDRFTLLANSDAHSAEKLGRNANLFKTELSYQSLVRAMKNRESGDFLGTINFFPQEGKYHYDGHRKCQVRWNPLQTLRHNNICPQCGKKVTVGVMNRVLQLADRTDGESSPNRLPFYSLIPLKELLSEIMGVGPSSRKVARTYETLINKLGPELDLLLHVPLSRIEKQADALLAMAIERMRERKVYIEEGYDGEYGRITVFKENEINTLGRQASLFRASADNGSDFSDRTMFNFDLAEYQRLMARQKDHTREQVALASVMSATDKPDYEAELDHDQLNAVRYTAGPSIILAGPGTGKTRTLTWKIAYLTGEQGVAVGRILALTFTNKAAHEIKKRLEHLLPGHIDRSSLQVFTFHALGLALLKEFFSLTGRNSGFTLLNEDDKLALLASIHTDKNRDVRHISGLISHLKQQLKSEKEILDVYLTTLFLEYEQLLFENNAFDLDDLVFQPVRMCEISAECARSLRDRFSWVLIDEYQDINYSQYCLMKKLLPDFNPHVCVIGDLNQSIYGFRGSDPQFMQNFLTDFPTARQFRLTRSYRCSDTILKAAAHVLGQRNSKTQSLNGTGAGERIAVHGHQTDKSEAEFAARTIENLIGGTHFFSFDSQISSGQEKASIRSLGDFAVLCRTREQIPAIEKALNDHNLPCQLISDIPFYRRKPVCYLIDLLRLYRHPDNLILRQRLQQNKIIGPHQELPREQFDEQSLGLWSLAEIMNWLHEKHFRESNRIDQTTFSQFIDYMNELNLGVDEFLELTTYGTGADTFRYRAEHISVMTLHAAKGLEFECVLVLGCDDGLIPYGLFEDQVSDQAEEKRLLYVGMTRARTWLFLCHAGKRFLFGREFHFSESPFLKDIPDEYADRTEVNFSAGDKQPATRQLSLFDDLDSLP